MFGFDKILHFIAGVGVYALARFVDAYLDLGITPGLAILLVLIVGIAKELIDKITHQYVELADVLATVVGGLFGFVIFYLFEII